MHTEPPDFDRAALVALLRGWQIEVTSLSYLPVGAGSHHYRVRDQRGAKWFVTVDELLTKLFGMLGPTFVPWREVDLDAGYAVLDRAFRTTHALRASGLEFVHAPIARPDGEVLARLGDFAVSVFPYIERIEKAVAPDQRTRALAALGRLHAALDALPHGVAQRDSLTVPLRLRFFETLDDLGSPWHTGPYGERARQLLRENADAIRTRFERCDELAAIVRATDKDWVVTHGQMHGGNVVRTEDDELILVDWDCVNIAPRERDLGTWGNGLEPRTEDDWAAYTAGGEARGIDPVAVELYRHIGLLWCICADTAIFCDAHVDNADTRHEWTNLRTALAEVAV